MLYDEEGRAYTEPPLIPEEQHLMYIVKDYRRMYLENARLTNRNNQLEKSNKALRHRILRQGKTVTEMYDVINHCVKHMKKCGVTSTTFLDEFIKKHKSIGKSIRYEETNI